jgi:hypothetical protein
MLAPSWTIGKKKKRCISPEANQDSNQALNKNSLQSFPWLFFILWLIST